MRRRRGKTGETGVLKGYEFDVSNARRDKKLRCEIIAHFWFHDRTFS